MSASIWNPNNSLFSAPHLLRVGVSEALSEIPGVATRKGKVVGFDAITGDVALYPAAASETILADLASTASDKGSSLVSFVPAGAGAVATTVLSKLRERVSLFDFLTPTQIADVVARTLITPATTITAAFNAAIAYAMATSGRLYVPAGLYKLNTLSISNVRGLVIEGAASSMLSGGITYANTSVLSFDSAASGTNGLVVDNFYGFTLRNINISMRRSPVGGGGVGFKLTTGHDFALENVKIDINVGGGGFAYQLGGGSGGTAAFMGTLTNCKAFPHTGAGFYLNFTTSITATACYSIGGPFQIAGSAYCTFISCAAEISPVGRYGYEVTGSSNLSFVSCGTEGNNRGGFYLTGGSFNLNFLNPYGAANNQSGDPVIGDLFQIDSTGGGVQNVIIDNPSALASVAATTANIYANAGNGTVTVNGVTNLSLSRGIKGHSVWLSNKLTFTGDDEKVTWTPVLSGWTNVGTPTITAYYVKKGTMVFFSITITPATSVSCTRPSSTITGLPFGALQGIVATMTDGNAVSYGAVTASLGSGILYPQTSGVLTVPITICGTLTF